MSLFYLIDPYLIRCMCEISIMDALQVYHANGEWHFQCCFLRYVVGNVDIL